MNAPVRAKAYNLPLRSKLLDWLEASPQKVATTQQWQGMLNNQQSVRREEVDRAGIAAISSIFEPDERLNKKALILGAKNNLAECFPTIQSYWKHSFRPSLDVKNRHRSITQARGKKGQAFCRESASLLSASFHRLLDYQEWL